MSSVPPRGPNGVPLTGSYNFNINLGSMPGMRAGMPGGSQQAKSAQAKSGGAGIKVNKQVILEEEDDEIGDDAEDYENFANVNSTALEHYGLAAHPSTVCEAATLSSVPSPEVDYAVKLPSNVLKSGAISALQFHAVRLACARHEQQLPDGSRAGFFLGDGPGVGKGRQIAATIFNYFCRGKTKALWVSVSTDLVVDARRDLEALGMLDYEAVKLHDLRQLRTKSGQPLSALAGLESGIMFCTYDLLCSGATPAKQKAAKGKAAKAKAVKGGVGSSGFGGCALAGQRSGSSSLWDDENTPPWEKAAFGDDDQDADEPEPDEFGPTSRLHQIVEWLGDGDYVIVLDECHKAKNAMPKGEKKNEFPIDMMAGDSFEQKKKGSDGWAKNSSKTARAVIELQRRLPNARVMYVSATGASEAENLCYMERLGLWGPGSAFPSKQEFVTLLKQGGIGAMELVAMELKGAGCYLSRSLSWADVRFETVAIDASDEFVSMYDAAVDVWHDTLLFLKDHGLDRGRIQDGNLLGQYGSAQLRFFRQLCTAAKVDTVVKLCEEALAANMCPVVGIQSTGEARTAEYVATMSKGNKDDDMHFDSFVEPAALILSSFIEKHLMSYPGALRLLQRAKNLVLPKNPLDDLIDRLGGPAKVAEMTGRQKRMERASGGGYKYVSRTDFYGGCSLDDVNILERAAFQQGRKRVAIISDAASAGISLHADKGAKNTAQRVQITLELAWSADKTVQQLGRTHRSNQVQPPIYKIVSTNICGEHRFASAVAHRLQQLGALTQGDRRAASASEALSSFNLQTKWAHNALKLLFHLVQNHGSHHDPTYANLTPPWLEDLMREGLPEGQELPEVGTQGYRARREAALKRWCTEAAALLETVGLIGRNKTATVHTLLNKLLGMRVEIQGQLFGLFSAILDKVVIEAKKDGKYDATGIIKPGCEKINLTSSKVVCMHPNGAAPTTLATFAMDRGVNFEKACKLLEDELRMVRKEQGEAAADRSPAGFYYSDSATRRFYTLVLPRNEKGLRAVKSRNGKVLYERARYFRLVRPVTGMGFQDITFEDLKDRFNKISNMSTAEREWTKAYNDGNNSSKYGRLLPLNLLTGSVLPLLKTINRVVESYRSKENRFRRMQLMRVETSDANMQRFIGVHVPEHMLNAMLSAIKEIEHLAPEQRTQQQEQKTRKGSSTAVTAAAAGSSPAAPSPAGTDIRTLLGSSDKPAAAAAAPAGTTAAAAAAAGAAAASSLPAGLDPAVLSLLTATSAAVGKSAELLGNAATATAAADTDQHRPADAAAAAQGEQQQQDQEQDDGSIYSSEDEETLGQRSTRTQQQRKRRAPGRNRMTRADAADADRAARGTGSRRAAAVDVVTEGLLAAGLWEEGGTDLTVRKGGAATAGGGGTRWKKFESTAKAGAAVGRKGSCGRGRGRPRKEEWLVSDEEDELQSEEAETSDEGDASDLEDVDHVDQISDQSDVDAADSEGDEEAAAARSWGTKGSRGTRSRRATAAAAAAAESPQDSQQAQQQHAAAEPDTDDDDVPEDEHIHTVDELPEFRPSKSKQKQKAAVAAAAAAADTAAEPAAEPVKKRGRRTKAEIAAAAAAAPVQRVTVSSRGRIRKVKLLPDGYVPLDDAFAEPAAQPPPATNTAAEPGGAAATGAYVQEPTADDDAAEPQTEYVEADTAAAAEPAPATAAAAAADHSDVDQMQQQQQQDEEQQAAQGATRTAAAAEAPVQQQSTAAAAVTEGTMDCDIEPAAPAEELPEQQQPTAADADGTADQAAAAGKAAAGKAAAAAAAAAGTSTAVLDESTVKAKVLEMLPGVAAASGESLSVKAVRLAVEAATGWRLDAAKLRAAVKDACTEFLQQQQQQQNKQQQQQQQDDAAACGNYHQGVPAAMVMKVVAKLLRKGGDACNSIKSVRLAAAARLGLTDLSGPHRSLVKQLVLAHLEQQVAAEQQQQQQDESQEVEQQQQQQQQESEAADDDDDDEIPEEEMIRTVDELPEFRPRKKGKTAAAAAAELEDDIDDDLLHNAGSGSRKKKRRSQQLDMDHDLDDTETLNDTDLAADAAVSPAAGAGDSSSKRRRLRHAASSAAATAGSSSAAAAAAAAGAAPPEGDLLLHDELAAGLVDELMQDLQSPTAAATTGAAAADSPIPANLFADSPSAQQQQQQKAPAAAGKQQHSAAAAAPGEAVHMASWGKRKRRSGWSSAATIAARAAAAAAPSPAAVAGSRVHQRRAVIADSDDEEEQQQDYHVADAAAAADDADPATTAAAAAATGAICAEASTAAAAAVSVNITIDNSSNDAVIAAGELAAVLQQQLEAARAHIAQLQTEATSAAHTESEKLRAEAEQLRDELATSKQQFDDVAAASQAEAVALRAELAAAKQAQAELTAAQASSDKLKAEAEQLRAELAAANQQREAAQTELEKLRAEAEQLRTELAAAKHQEAATAAAQAESDKLRAEQLRTELAALRKQQGEQAEHAATAAEQEKSSAVASSPAPATAATAGDSAAASPASVTPVPWAGLSRAASLLKTPAATTGAAGTQEDDPPTPRIGCFFAVAADTPAGATTAKQVEQQQQPPASPVTPGTAVATAASKQHQPTPLPTLDDVRNWLEDHPKGATAVQIMQAFGSNKGTYSSSSSNKGVEEKLSVVMCGLLQQLVDDVEVIRKGGAAATTSAVDVADAETLYMALC